MPGGMSAGTAWIAVKPNPTGWSGLKKSLAIAAPLAAVAATAFKVGSDFDEMKDTIIVGTGASGKALAGLERSAKRVGKTTPADFKDVGTAIADVNTRLGLTGKPLEQVSKRFLNLSRITGTDLAGNIAAGARAFGDWGIAVKDQPKALDKLFFTSQATGIGLDALAQQVVTFGAPMRQFGFSFEESISLMGKWEKEGVNANAVFAGMKVGLGAISKAGKDPQKEFARITKRIKEAGSAGKANQIAIETFGQRAGPDLAAAVREGRFEIDDMVKALDGSGGSINDADKRTRDWRASLQILRNKAMVYIKPLADKMFQAISDGAVVLENKVIPTVKRLVKFVDDNSTAFKVGAGVVGTLVTAIVVYKTTVMVVTKVTKAWTIAQALLNRTMKLNPIGLVVTALVLLGTGLVIAYKKSETFRKVVDGAFQAIAKAGRWLWNNVLQPVFSSLVKGLGWVMSKWGDMLRALSKVPGFGWADAAGRKMQAAGQDAIDMAEDIKKIPNDKNVKVTADMSGANRAIQYTANQLADLQRLAGRGIRVAGVSGAGGHTARAIGGPVVAGRPYLVGERGPELIVPRAAGHVMTAAQTRRAMQTARYDPAVSASQWRDMGARSGGDRHVHQNFPTIDASASTAVASRALSALASMGV